MLVITRKDGQDIVIDGQIRISIIAVEGRRVRVGITAPKEMRVDRQERLEGVGFAGLQSQPCCTGA